MKKELKSQIIDQLTALIEANPNFYVTDIAGLNAEQTHTLRRACFDNNIKMMVVKNTLLAKVLKQGNEEMQSICSIL
ncbi:MAG: 50S ribosomal protein L10, partial [Bacteroidaceae bacterium]|nr:50S ribosomal protein L10 [Bacteroidaceae bacterium]